ncbi:MAG: SgcJ/EcaC family oxidoreductase [Armatimonadetes bacterium]|nr:SgcJ/EcaC family oxidoreductase [Armatimonadota bacterium]
MKTSQLTLLLTVATSLVATLGMPQPAQSSQPQKENKSKMNQQQEEVQKVITTMTEAFHKGDIHGVMASYTKDAVVVFERQKPTAGYDAIKQKFEETFSIKPKFEYSGHEVFVAGDTALHIAPWVMHATLPDGTAIQDSGLSVASLRRQADGRWLMTIDDPYGSFLLK